MFIIFVFNNHIFNIIKLFRELKLRRRMCLFNEKNQHRNIIYGEVKPWKQAM